MLRHDARCEAAIFVANDNELTHPLNSGAGQNGRLESFSAGHLLQHLQIGYNLAQPAVLFLELP
jgi:hypothetical protein